ncbi:MULTISPECIES: TraR/DksA C4-type zinc finger protein [Paenibacillus]|uniref:Molecular chaperone DnaK n=1 Tax=Paenibacillus campinasensis TaxID=66347 RepID=A0A268F4U6_9BACL|nr:TraR/DksA C4-type zinc finger protein [Paenibacillus campinasensis]MUG64675.1 molecular chaperone DnaK [Paenibacillus campinasensis]PAD80392.1 molecular chaperone DnaK [Paenibacillus campinasensis]
MSHLTQEQIRRLKQRLMERKAELESRMVHNDQHGMGESERDYTGELSHIDNHPGDLATEVYEREKDLALQDRMDLELQRVIFSLEAIHHGRYGTCIICGEAIPYERLEAVPDTQYCLKDNPRQNPSHDRPVEEEFLHPPFGRSSLDEHEYSGFDGEDAWQIVESWGNSNSPALAEGNNIDSYNEMDIEHEDDQGGFVEVYENFVATNIDGTDVFFVRSPQYVEYIQRGEGSFLLDPNVPGEDDDDTLI